MAKPTIMKMDTEQDRYLLYLVEKGMLERYDENEDYIRSVLAPRIKEELRVITNSGFTNYFLIVGDFMQWCRNNGIATGPARGSAGGSVVAYCLYITDVDPIKHDLIFERFLNDERVAMPDIDLDICWHRRQDAIEYLVGKYGEDHVAQIITFGTLSAKALLDDLGRVLQIPKKDIEELKKHVPMMVDSEDKVAADDKVRYVDLVGNEAFITKLHEVGEQDPRFIPALANLEGLHRHGSVHAGGIIISDRPMTDLAPTYKPPKAKRPVLQYEMFDAEAVGLLKVDVLGLRTVTHVDWAEKIVNRLFDPNFRLKGYREDDQAAFDIINAGDTHGIFQLDGTGITKFAQQMRMDSFNDIVALLALYRPGTLDSGMAEKYIARKNGQEPVTYPHPDLEPILKDTYGIIVYQEQVMFVLQKMGGFTLGQADVARKAMGKKNAALMKKELDRFKDGALAKGYDLQKIEEVSDLIKTFARYGFNKSHAVAYAYLTYWTAILKARYPIAFFTAWLNITGDGAKQGWIMDQAARKGIKVLPPDINHSGDIYTAVDEQTIRFGLSAVKGMGKSFVDKTMIDRDTHGAYAGYYDYCQRMTSIPVDKKEALVGAGAFDFDEAGRAFLYKHARTIADLAKKSKALEDLEQVEPMRPLELADLEKEYVNFYITADPIKGVQEELRMLGGVVGVPVTELHGEPVVGGRITHVHTLNTKKGDQMAFIDLDDGIIQHSVTLFPSVWKRVAPHMVEGEYSAMRCEIGRFRGQPTLQAVAVFPIDLKNRDSDLVLNIGRHPSRLTLAMIKATLDQAEAGDSRVRLVVENGSYRFTLQASYTIKITDDIIGGLKGILGATAVGLDRRA